MLKRLHHDFPFASGRPLWFCLNRLSLGNSRPFEEIQHEITDLWMGACGRNGIRQRNLRRVTQPEISVPTHSPGHRPRSVHEKPRKTKEKQLKMKENYLCGSVSRRFVCSLDCAGWAIRRWFIRFIPSFKLKLWKRLIASEIWFRLFFFRSTTLLVASSLAAHQISTPRRIIHISLYLHLNGESRESGAWIGHESTMNVETCLLIRNYNRWNKFS